jgi:hypothetical protein
LPGISERTAKTAIATVHGTKKKATTKKPTLPTPPQKAKTVDADDPDSPRVTIVKPSELTLHHLKRHWRKATKADRAAFQARSSQIGLIKLQRFLFGILVSRYGRIPLGMPAFAHDPREGCPAVAQSAEAGRTRSSLVSFGWAGHPGVLLPLIPRSQELRFSDVSPENDGTRN